MHKHLSTFQGRYNKFKETWPKRRQWHPTPVLLPGKSHGQRSLKGCSPWGRWGSDTTERPHFHFSLSCSGEGNGNPLQCSCLENPRDGGAWWAAIYGVAQSQTRLKWLSSRPNLNYQGMKLSFSNWDSPLDCHCWLPGSTISFAQKVSWIVLSFVGWYNCCLEILWLINVPKYYHLQSLQCASVVDLDI